MDRELYGVVGSAWRQWGGGFGRCPPGLECLDTQREFQPYHRR